MNTEKCNVWCCTNYKHQGEFNGEFCVPCYVKITTGVGSHGTAWFYQLSNQWREMKDKFNKIINIIEE